MSVAAKPRCAVVFLMVLTLGVSLGLPAEDVLDAVYDESETLPYDTPLDSNMVALTAGATTQATPTPLHLKLVAPSPFPAAHIRDTDAHRSSDTRALSARLCTLRC